MPCRLTRKQLAGGAALSIVSLIAPGPGAPGAGAAPEQEIGADVGLDAGLGLGPVDLGAKLDLSALASVIVPDPPPIVEPPPPPPTTPPPTTPPPTTPPPTTPPPTQPEPPGEEPGAPGQPGKPGDFPDKPPTGDDQAGAGAAPVSDTRAAGSSMGPAEAVVADPTYVG